MYLALTFRGGIHINDYKLTATCKTEVLPQPKRVTIPLSQHIGVPCTATVKVGDTVEQGQQIL